MKFELKSSVLIWYLLSSIVGVLVTKTIAQNLPDECDLYANECIPLKDCAVLNTLILGNENIITPDVAEKLEKSKCTDNSTNVCCPKTTTEQDDIEVDIGTRFADDTCVTPRRENGVCKPIKKCASIFKIITKGRITADESNYLRGSQCDYKNRTPYVCCPDQRTSVPNTGQRTKDLLPAYDQCGVLATDKIVGGTQTKIDEYPWMGLIQYTDKTKSGRKMFGCGSSLISSKYVLTAAHCASSAEIPKRFQPLLVRFGEWDTSTDEDCDTSRGYRDCVTEPVQDIPIERITVHENYRKDSTNVHNDIALIRLRQPARMNFFVGPICLPRTNDVRQVNLVNKLVSVAGWGTTEQRVKSNIKLKVDLNVMSNTDCQRSFSPRQIVSTQLCAGGEEGKDSCSGDSGGPLMNTHVVGSRTISYLAGIVSYGSRNCGTRGLPGVYTRVSEYMTWIESNLSE